MKSYSEFAAYLGSKTSRPLANNTRVEKRGDNIAVKLHATDVITFLSNGNVILNSGGWKTVTTKARMNEYSPARISQSKGQWTVAYGSLSVPYADGIIIHVDGSMYNYAAPDKLDEDKALRKRIAAYAKQCAAAVPMPAPGAGDCFFCQMVDVTTGKPMPGTDHFHSHFDEGYVVPSLVYRALKETGNTALVVCSAFDQGQDSKWLLGIARERVQRSVAKYLRRQFGLV